ncbi:MAG: hypothetical protein IPI97_08195 [Nitrosomonas sp.]|nr:hypothetical protein [Nitrosomonas sp.]MBK7364968.1 hypothetical protein [Nitrosomonas sp.]
MRNRVELNTYADADGKIIQEIFYIENGVVKTVDFRIMDTCDDQIREALIKLGWTPLPLKE